MAPKPPGSGGNGSHCGEGEALRPKGNGGQFGPGAKPGAAAWGQGGEDWPGSSARGEVDTGVVSFRMSILHHFNSEHRTYTPGSPSGMQETVPRRLPGATDDGRAERSGPMPGFPRVFPRVSHLA